MPRHCLHVFIALFLLLVSAYGQDDKRIGIALLVDEFGKSSGEERSARFDNFFVQLNNDPDATGYIFVYCGKSCRYGEIESHLRGIELKINGYGFDRKRIVVMNGGYRDYQETELWLIVQGSSVPTPRPTRNIKNVTFLKANGKIIEAYDCCDDIDGQWKAFRPKN